MAFQDSLVEEMLRLGQVKDFQNKRASSAEGLWLDLGTRLGLVLRQGDDPYDLCLFPFWM